jgi:hypothetical protein
MPETPPVQPDDVHNQFPVGNVHPPDWGILGSPVELEVIFEVKP